MMFLPPFALEHFMEAHEFSAKHLFACSDAETLSVEELLALAENDLRQMWHSMRLGYTEVRGHPLLREEIASFCGLESASSVVVTSGAQEAITMAALSLLTPADHAVVLTPCYQSLLELPRARAAITEVALREDEGWRISLGRIEEALRPNSKLLVVNFPHNPTGATLDPAEADALIQFVEDNNLILISDEVYRGSEHRQKEVLPSLSARSPNVVSIGVLSKAFGLAGLRIGWVAAQRQDLLASIASVKHYLSICSSGPSEVLAIMALRNAKHILRRSRSLITENLAKLNAVLSEHNELVSWVPPKGGCTGFLRLLTGESADVFSRRLLEAEGVLVLPGTVYGDYPSHVRIGFGRRDFESSLSAFAACLRS